MRCVPGRAEIYASINALSRREDLPGASAHQGMQPAMVMRGSRCWQVAKTVLGQGCGMWGEVGLAKYTDSSARDRKPAASICTGRTWSAQDELRCHKAERWWQHGLTTAFAACSGYAMYSCCTRYIVSASGANHGFVNLLHSAACIAWRKVERTLYLSLLNNVCSADAPASAAAHATHCRLAPGWDP